MNKRILIEGLTKSFQNHKELAEQAFKQLDFSGLHWKPEGNSNNVSILIKHTAGHLKSRFADFFISDGEHIGRNREKELLDEKESMAELEKIWANSWSTVFFTLQRLTDEDLEKIKKLRGESLLVAEYIPRVLTHYTYHVGQIVLLAKLYLGDKWKKIV